MNFEEQIFGIVYELVSCFHCLLVRINLRRVLIHVQQLFEGVNFRLQRPILDKFGKFELNQVHRLSKSLCNFSNVNDFVRAHKLNQSALSDVAESARLCVISIKQVKLQAFLNVFHLFNEFVVAACEKVFEYLGRIWRLFQQG